MYSSTSSASRSCGHEFSQLKPVSAAETKRQSNRCSLVEEVFISVVTEIKFSRGQPVANEQQITAATAQRVHLQISCVVHLF